MAKDPLLFQKIARTRDLPTLPDVVHLTLSSLDSPSNGAEEVAQIIAEDPAMTASVLRIANSVIHNPTTKRIDSATLAVARIGFDEVRRMVLAIGVVDLFRDTKVPFDYFGFWRHCIATGLFAEAVAQTSSVVESAEPIDDGVYFAGGLLHDIGVLPLAAELADKYARLMRTYERGDVPISVLEQKRLGLTHGEVGAEIMSRWSISQSVVHAARFHDTPEAAPQVEQTFVRVVHVANWLAEHVGFGISGRQHDLPFLNDVWCKLALQESDIPLIQARFDRLLEQSKLFGVVESR